MFSPRSSIIIIFEEGTAMRYRLPRKLSSIHSAGSLKVRKGTEDVINVVIDLPRIWLVIVHRISRCGWNKNY